MPDVVFAETFGDWRGFLGPRYPEHDGGRHALCQFGNLCEFLSFRHEQMQRLCLARRRHHHPIIGAVDQAGIVGGRVQNAHLQARLEAKLFPSVVCRNILRKTCPSLPQEPDRGTRFQLAAGRLGGLAPPHQVLQHFNGRWLYHLNNGFEGLLAHAGVHLHELAASYVNRIARAHHVQLSHNAARMFDRHAKHPSCHNRQSPRAYASIPHRPGQRRS